MKNLLYIFIILIITGIISFAGVALAQVTAETTNIQYPIKELGNCGNKPACKTYCDKTRNSEACLNFALKNNLMSQEQIETAKKFLDATVNRPGDCTTKESCVEYCNDITHIDECASFIEENGLISAEKLLNLKKVQSAILEGLKLPNCNNKEECNVYCEGIDHMQECIAFGQTAKLLEGKNLESAQKIYKAIKDGITPPPCKGKENCDIFCSQAENMKACMNFSMQAGLMTEKERTNAQKMLTAINKGAKPPKCKSKEECDTYCKEPEHVDECIIFVEMAGIITTEEAKTIRETGNRGPGGCANENECANQPEDNENIPTNRVDDPPSLDVGISPTSQPSQSSSTLPAEQVTSGDIEENLGLSITPQSVLGAIIYGIQLFVPGK